MFELTRLRAPIRIRMGILPGLGSSFRPSGRWMIRRYAYTIESEVIDAHYRYIVRSPQMIGGFNLQAIFGAFPRFVGYLEQL